MQSSWRTGRAAPPSEIAASPISLSAKDIQMMKLAADKRSMGNPGARTSSSWMPVIARLPRTNSKPPRMF